MKKEDKAVNMLIGYIIGVFVTNVAWLLAETLGWLK